MGFGFLFVSLKIYNISEGAADTDHKRDKQAAKVTHKRKPVPLTRFAHKGAILP